MPKKGFIPVKLKPWIEARQRFGLSHAQVQMARELGMNPKKLGGMANHRQEPWKLPLPVFIEQCYEKQFHQELPHDVRSIEEKEAERRARKEARRAERNTQSSNAGTSRSGGANTPRLATMEYHSPMQVATGTVVDGKVVVEGLDLVEGETVTVLTRGPEDVVQISPEEEAELLEAIAEVDRGETISAEELFARLDGIR